ncbi:hypothetical protein [Congregibacter sp.]|jgi:hypothetical protein|uniref:hypothetical protein n=2 Tax=Congregibacter sp. TaxID=2744308 RepID=UPI0039E258A7
MTLSELGSLGEIVGSLAVLITLVILVVQVRGARTEMSAQMTREIKRDNNEAYHQLIQNPDLVKLHIRGQSEFESLTDAEKVTWAIWLFTWINQAEDAWVVSQRGMPNMEWVETYVTGVALVIRSDGGQAVWPRLRGFFDETFAEAVDQRVREGNESFLQALLD